MIVIEIPLEIPSQNKTEKGRSWRARAGMTRDRRNAWAMLCRSQMAKWGIPKATGPRSIKIVSFRKRRCYDIANLIGGAKSCVDGMVDAGLLLDDADSKAAITYEQRLQSDRLGALRKDQPCTLIHVELAP